MSDDAMFRKIKKALALAQNAGTAEEAASAWAKVGELLRKHRVTMEEVYSQASPPATQPRLPGQVDRPERRSSWSFGQPFRLYQTPRTIYQITPDAEAHSGRSVEHILHAISALHEYPWQRAWLDGTTFVYKLQDTVSYRFFFEYGRISMYLLIPENEQGIRLAAESVWPKAGFLQVEEDPAYRFHGRKLAAGYLELREHFFLSTLVDRKQNAPLTTLIPVIKQLKERDLAMVDITLLPIGNGWQELARAAMNRHKRGLSVPRPATRARDHLLKVTDFLYGELDQAYQILDDVLGIQIAKSKQKDLTRMGHVLNSASEDKFKHPGFEAVIRLVARSETNGPKLLQAMTLGFQSLSADNGWRFRAAKHSVSFVQQWQKGRLPPIRGNILSLPEVSQLVQIPSPGIQQEYEEIRHIPRVEVEVSPELRQQRGIMVGEVSHKGIRHTIRIPVAPFPGVTRDNVYDALNTFLAVFGKQGVGKTQGIGARIALDMITNGFTAFYIDTADGQIAKTIIDALPEDYPEEKIIFLDFRQKAVQIPVTYADLADIVSGANDPELEELLMSQRLTTHLMEFLNNQAVTGPLTDRMRRYFASVAKAVGGKPLDIELALTSPAFREELLRLPEVISQPGIANDLRDLQMKALDHSDHAIIDPIVNRLKMLSDTTLLSNVFLSEDKRDEAGRLLLNFRRFADNPEGGYGYCVVIATSNDPAYGGAKGQELICSTLQAKIFLAAYSRADQDQSERKTFASIVDEPHRFIRAGAAKRLYSDAGVELRKYRCKNVMLAHSPSQLGEVWDVFAAGGAQMIAYKTERTEDYAKLAPQLSPYSPEYVYEHLADRGEAVCKLRLPSGKASPAFFCDMAKPPKFVKDRRSQRDACAAHFGIPWKEAKQRIDGLRLLYQQLDEEWYAQAKMSKSSKKRTQEEDETSFNEW